MNMRLSLLVIIPALLGACTSQDDGFEHAFHEYRDQGIRVAETQHAPRYEGELFEYLPVLRIVEDPQITSSYLADPGDFVRDSNGYFYVPDKKDSRIVVFDSEGRYIRDFSRSGSGPGEFQSIEIQSIHGDQISLFDTNLDRTTVFNTNGELRGVYSTPSATKPLENLFRTNDGILIGTRYENDRGVEVDRRRLIAVAYSSDGDTLAHWFTDLVDTYYKFQTFDGGRYGRSYDFCGHPRARYDPITNRMLLISGIERILRWYLPSGELDQIIRIDIPLDPIKASDKAPIIQQRDQMVQNSKGTAREFQKAMRDGLRFLHFKGVASNIHVDDSGYIWIAVPESISDPTWPGSFLYHVVDPNGRYLGETRLPRRMGFVIDGYVLLVMPDHETGASIPTVYKISPIPSDLKYH